MKFAIYGDNTFLDGNETAAFNPRTARAFCDGRLANANGELSNNNPFSAETEAENRKAWANGYSSYAIGLNEKGYCAV